MTSVNLLKFAGRQAQAAHSLGASDALNRGDGHAVQRHEGREAGVGRHVPHRSIHVATALQVGVNWFLYFCIEKKFILNNSQQHSVVEPKALTMLNHAPPSQDHPVLGEHDGAGAAASLAAAQLGAAQPQGVPEVRQQGHLRAGGGLLHLDACHVGKCTFLKMSNTVTIE